MTSTLTLINNVIYLKLPPEAWDAIYPQGPDLSPSIRQYMAAGLVRNIAARVTDRTASAALKTIGKQLAGIAARELVQSFDEDPDICPPWPWPHNWPWAVAGNPVSDPEPAPWETASMEQAVLGSLVASVAKMVGDAEVRAELVKVSRTIIKGAANQLVAENG